TGARDRFDEVEDEVSARRTQPRIVGSASEGAEGAVERELERAIGATIRSLRRQADLTVADLGQAAGVSGGMISRIETGQISPSLSTLQAIARALKVPITQLFSGIEDNSDCSFVEAGKGLVVERRGTKSGHNYSLIGHSMVGQPLVIEPLLITLDEHSTTYTEFRHPGQELIYMLSGSVVYRWGDREFTMKAGDALMFDSTSAHGPAKLLTKTSSYLSVVCWPRQP
ncbi:MAG: XRE family transcriptional regulator, partial [Caulobacteraceae bacterium]|nr:XRE family transcriptional regulator [Caulobacteraceae bacterium]